MEPTQGRTAGGNRPSAAKRYGPLAVIVAIVAVVAIVVAVTSSSDDKKAVSTTTTAATGGANSKAWPIFTAATKSSGKWGPNCDVKTGRVAIPWTYAPPCAQQSTGDNGGATADGVTGDSIKVIVYQGDPDKNPLQAATVKSSGAAVDNASARETYRGYFDLFEKYYNLYGRKIDLQFFPGTGGPMDEVTARADAQAIADMHPFAVLSGPNQTPVWAEELTSRHVLCLGNCSLAVPTKTVTDNSPYLVGVGPTPEQAGLMTAKLVVDQLKGKKAIYGGADVKNKPRVFAVTHYDTIDGQQKAAFQVLKSKLTEGGVKIAANLPFQLDLARGQENARTMVAKLKAARATTVIYTGDPITPIALTKEATAQNYFPEWVLGANVLADTAVFGRLFDQEQWSHAFGLGLNPAKVVQSKNQAFSLYKWFNGKEAPNNTYGVILADLTSLFQGIHLAGPDLTPQSFQNGLWNSPITGGTPLSPRVSRGHHGMWPGTDVGGSDDTGLLWWNSKATGEDEIGKVGPGLYEYAAMGKRWPLADMPSADPGYFDESKSVKIFETVPKAFQPPSYPSPAK